MFIHVLCLFIGVAETVSSLTWLPKDPKLLVASVGNKHLKIFDIRGTDYFVILMFRQNYYNILQVFLVASGKATISLILPTRSLYYWCSIDTNS